MSLSLANHGAPKAELALLQRSASRKHHPRRPSEKAHDCSLTASLSQCPVNAGAVRFLFKSH
eukprot:1144459-Pelagomonas_calceolata.AAC.3